MLCLIDTSVWIDFFRGKGVGKSKLLANLISEGADIAYTGIILTEVLLGFRNDDHNKSAKNLFKNLIYLESKESTYLLASEIYRVTRKQGVTIRSTIDCIISAVALENRAYLLENDKDYQRISKFYDLKLIQKGS